MKSFLLAASAIALGIATSAGATTIGPDSYGYVATDQVTYTFQDIRNTGTRILVGVDDNGVGVALPFAFNFYGAGYSTAYLTSNGEILFGGNSGQFTNTDLTLGSGPGAPGIYTYWDDLYTRNSDDAGVYYQTIGTTPGSRKFVVQEVANSYNVGGAVINFQTVLDEASGDILMRYTQTAFGVPGAAAYDNGGSATVGIQGSFAAGQTVQWSFNQPTLRDNESLCFTRNPNAACNAIVDQPAVPEPASWALMIAGFGATGAVLRRRRATPRLATA